MAYIVILVLLVIVTLASRGEMDKSSVVMCNSVSCNWNRRCRCTRKEIAVYDNTVRGLCLYHTEDMKDRILEPIRKNKLLDGYGHETYVVADALKKTQGDMKDEELLKSPRAFSQWMKRHGAGG
jgi:hypothetical protein